MAPGCCVSMMGVFFDLCLIKSFILAAARASRHRGTLRNCKWVLLHIGQMVVCHTASRISQRPGILCRRPDSLQRHANPSFHTEGSCNLSLEASGSGESIPHTRGRIRQCSQFCALSRHHSNTVSLYLEFDRGYRFGSLLRNRPHLLTTQSLSKTTGAAKRQAGDGRDEHVLRSTGTTPRGII